MSEAVSGADFSTLFGIAKPTLLISGDLKYLSALSPKLPTMESAIQMIRSLARQQAASADHASVLGGVVSDGLLHRRSARADSELL